MGKPRERGAGLGVQHSSDGGRKEEEDTHIKRIIRLAVDCVGVGGLIDGSNATRNACSLPSQSLAH